MHNICNLHCIRNVLAWRVKNGLPNGLANIILHGVLWQLNLPEVVRREESWLFRARGSFSPKDLENFRSLEKSLKETFVFITYAEIDMWVILKKLWPRMGSIDTRRKERKREIRWSDWPQARIICDDDRSFFTGHQRFKRASFTKARSVASTNDVRRGRNVVHSFTRWHDSVPAWKRGARGSLRESQRCRTFRLGPRLLSFFLLRRRKSFVFFDFYIRMFKMASRYRKYHLEKKCWINVCMYVYVPMYVCLVIRQLELL